VPSCSVNVHWHCAVESGEHVFSSTNYYYVTMCSVQLTTAMCIGTVLWSQDGISNAMALKVCVCMDVGVGVDLGVFVHVPTYAS
jgi:hypothetical protein